MTDLAPFPIPERGLAEVLSAWTGEGAADELFRTLGLLGAADEEDGALAERAWLEERSARERANRVLIGRLSPLIEKLPDRGRVWIRALPADTVSTRVISDRPNGSVDWARTSVEGWPPRRFHLKVRHRSDDSVLARVVGWTVDALLGSAEDARRLTPKLVSTITPNLVALRSLASHPVIERAGRVRPSTQEVRAVRALGRPWASLVPITEYYLRLGDVSTLASELIIPEPDLAWRLFHLACFGEILATLRDEGCDVTATAPLYGGSSNPAYLALVPDGSRIDVWFEASGCWRTYAPGIADPYRLAAQSASRAGVLSPDILLVRTRPDTSRAALVFECKSGSDAASAARDGYMQAVSYGVQLHAMSGVQTSSWVVGRDDLFGLPTAASLQGVGLQSVGMVAGGSCGSVTSLWIAETTAAGIAET